MTLDEIKRLIEFLREQDVTEFELDYDNVKLRLKSGASQPAQVPMLPVVAGVENTRKQIFYYTLPMAAAAIAPWPLRLAGVAYGMSAAILSFVFLVLAGRVLANRSTDPKQMAAEKHLFAYSIFYLFALFTALVVDRWIA